MRARECVRAHTYGLHVWQVTRCLEHRFCLFEHGFLVFSNTNLIFFEHGFYFFEHGFYFFEHELNELNEY